MADQGFQDYTNATEWERFSSAIALALTDWMAQGLGRLLQTGDGSGGQTLQHSAVLRHRMPQRSEPFVLTLHLPLGPAAQQRSRTHTPALPAKQPDDTQSAPGGGLRAGARLSGSRLAQLRVSSDEVGAGAGAGAASSPGASPAPSEAAYGSGESLDGESLGVSFTASPDPGAEEEDTATTQPARPGPQAAGPAGVGQAGPQRQPRPRQGLQQEREGPTSRFKLPDTWWPACGAGPALRDRPHKLQQCFGVDAFLVLAPRSYTGRLLNELEASTVLSALATALSSTAAPFPGFIPVHDPLRDAWWGAAVVGHEHVAFDSDSLHSSELPTAPQTVPGQLELFASLLERRDRRAARAVREALLQPGDPIPQGSPQGPGPPCVSVTLRRTFPLPRPSHAAEDEVDDAVLSLDADWDAESAWRPWAVQADPLGGLEVDLVWDGVPASVASSEPGALDPERASHMRLVALAPAPNAPSWTFLAQAEEAPRQHLTLRPPQPLAGEDASPEEEAAANPQVSPAEGSFAALVGALLEGRRWAAEARDVGQLASSEWWYRRGTYCPATPSDAALQDTLRDLFVAPALPAAFSRGTLPVLSASTLGAAQGESLAARLALHALTLGSPRAVATLWLRVVRELRFAHWEACVRLPSRPAGGRQEQPAPELLAGPDPALSLLEQKLQLLEACIRLRQDPSGLLHPSAPRVQPRQGNTQAEELARRAPQEGGSSSSGSSSSRSSGEASGYESAESTAGGAAAGGAREESPGLGLELGFELPVVQRRRPMTSDLVAERDAALNALGEASGGLAAARLLAAPLRSDMAAFKAANGPSATLTAFQAWQGLCGRTAPYPDPLLGELWEETAPQPAREQRPLWDPLLEGERALHWLETAAPSALWDHLLALGLPASLACLGASRGAALPSARAALTAFEGLLPESLEACLGTPQGEAPPPPRAATRQLRDIAQSSSPAEQRLLRALSRLEAVVAAGESLLLRLPGRPGLAEALLSLALCDPAGPHDSAAGDSAAAGQQQQGEEMDSPPQGLLVESEGDLAALSSLLSQRRSSSAVAVKGERRGSEGGVASWAEGWEAWPQARQTEWLLQCVPSSRWGGAKGAGAHPGGTACRGHQLYVRARPGELRLASVLYTVLS